MYASKSKEDKKHIFTPLQAPLLSIGQCQCTRVSPQIPLDTQGVESDLVQMFPGEERIL